MGRQQLAVLLDALAVHEGVTQSNLAGVFLFRASEPIPRSPMIYEPSIVVVAQGRKRGYLGEEVYTYDANNFLVLSVPLPLECETIEASPEKPALVISIPVNHTTLGELLLEMDDDPKRNKIVPRGIYATALEDTMADAVVRLLGCLSSAMNSRILGPQIIREIIFLVLCGERGGALRVMANRHGQFNQIARILKIFHMEYPKTFDINMLADEANMSVSAFHHTFKMVTATSPLQYLKNIRLHKARLMMVQDGFNASTAAGMVGYESPSQFSREFKRLFGTSPMNEAGKLRVVGVDKRVL